MNFPTFAFAVFLATAMDSSSAPRLVVSTPSLAPESKIDLVLDLPVTETTELGKTVDHPPFSRPPVRPLALSTAFTQSKFLAAP